MEKSTRISIVEHSLADVLERLAELPDTPVVASLRLRARAYEDTVKRWEVTRPSEGERESVLRRVLDLNVEVIHAGARRSIAPPDDEEEDAEEGIPTQRRGEPPGTPG